MIDLKDKVFPSSVRKGVVFNGDRVIFSVENKATYDFEQYLQSCGCVGNIELLPRSINFNIEAKFKSGSELFTDGYRYFTMVDVGGTLKPFNVDTNQYEVDIPADLKKLEATKFNQTVPVYFKDGQTLTIIEPNGRQKENPLKHKADIEITFYVLKK